MRRKIDFNKLIEEYESESDAKVAERMDIAQNLQNIEHLSDYLGCDRRPLVHIQDHP